mmetsp:Transcript_35790/g.43211  ORF Transcript_35790/g.43211 Transcript_35790/m.43211 type:complete len:149 (+) Transcript_35790:101-547(+)|eukprot:CAMPEP_0197848042 /NCGR_PEP_ID=MMETSP1438-20131217/7894_1 /TAXON_ID=1461541 /ORGANISM="Pterosperma sp., Strain CCMP1384" /LENGTH=148 /DNA_ID=CAMNT_0043460169 /DNA_START=90 /DNA_END=536 /DNA_ORIENTATION=-
MAFALSNCKTVVPKTSFLGKTNNFQQRTRAVSLCRTTRPCLMVQAKKAIRAKKDMVDEIAERTGLSKTNVEAVYVEVWDVIKDTMLEGEKVQVTGFGSFEAKKRGARAGRNPRTGEALEIPAKMVPSFSSGKGLKDALSAVDVDDFED